jgi:hypothetical protein
LLRFVGSHLVVNGTQLKRRHLINFAQYPPTLESTVRHRRVVVRDLWAGWLDATPKVRREELRQRLGALAGDVAGRYGATCIRFIVALNQTDQRQVAHSVLPFRVNVVLFVTE